MGIHLLAFAVARGFLQVFQVSAPLLWPLNLWVPLARHLPEACAALYGLLASHAAWLHQALERAAVRSGRHSGRGGVVDDYVLHAMLSISD